MKNLRSKTGKGLSMAIIAIIAIVLIIMLINASKLTIIDMNAHVTIDGKVVEFNDELGKPYLIKETQRTIVPLRIIAESMGYDVSWDQKLKKAIVIGNGTTVELIIGKNTALVNGKTVPIDTKDGKPVNTQSLLLPVKGSSRTYVPLRFIAEITGAEIKYSQKNGVHYIEINTGGEITPDPKPQPGNVTFDKNKDTLPDGRMNEAKTIEYLDEIIKNSKVYTENGKYYLEYNKVDVPEGYSVGLALNVSLKPGVSNVRPQTLSYSPLVNVAENSIPRGQSFNKELRKDAVENSDLIMFSISVNKEDYSGSGGQYSIAYKIDYDTINNTATNYKKDKWTAGSTVPFDKNLIFKDFKIIK